MMNRNKFFSAVFILFLGCSLMNSSLIWAQPMKHVVQKGDTLWDLCEKYYGDPNLWPKLWQMNPFITNPHLLKPGDVITLLEGVPIKKPEEKKEIAVKEPAKPKPVVTEITGIDISSLTNVHALGYLSDREVGSWGDMFASESGRILLSPGETVFVRFTKEEAVRPGDQFSVCKSSPLLKHPITGEKIGYILSVRGRLVIEEPAGVSYAGGKYEKKKNVYKARILNLYKTLNVGDLIIPDGPVSPCVLPLPMDKPVQGNIVAAQDQVNLIGPNTIVYIDRGFNQGVRRGNVFQAIKTHIVPDPDAKSGPFVKSAKIILPDIPIGTILVLESRPETATAIVLSTKEEFPAGTYIKGLSWAERPELLTRIPTCPTE